MKNVFNAVKIAVFAVLSVITGAMYVALLVLTPSKAVAFAALSFVFFIVSVIAWTLCPKVRSKPKSEFVFSLPSDAVIRPRLLYRVCRFFLIVGVVLFCAGNCAIALADVKNPSLIIFFCTIAVFMVGLYISVVRKETHLLAV